jgi:hypothetical protein
MKDSHQQCNVLWIPAERIHMGGEGAVSEELEEAYEIRHMAPPGSRRVLLIGKGSSMEASE